MSTYWDLGDRTQPDADFSGPTPASLLTALVKPRRRTEAEAPPELVARAVAIGVERGRDDE